MQKAFFMKLHILGGGHNQIALILRAKELGFEVLVSDYLDDAPGKTYADETSDVSTFDVQRILEISRERNVQGILTMGTDQPVLTAAKTAEALGLPTLLTAESALALTNKRVMKQVFSAYGIPTVPYTLYDGVTTHNLKMLKKPFVVKPVDSQGQRGVMRLETIDAIQKAYAEVASFSRETGILVEEYYESNEITVSGWVSNGRVYILTVTDRITYENLPSIGVCIGHRFPSVFAKEYETQINELSQKIADACDLYSGPIYIQFLVGENGLLVNEAAARIGGAFEEITIPYITEFPILDNVIQAAAGEVCYTYVLSSLPTGYDIKTATTNVGEVCDTSVLSSLPRLERSDAFFVVILFFASPGSVAFVGDVEKLYQCPGVISASYRIKTGWEILPIQNAGQRAGYVIITGNTTEELQKRIIMVEKSIEILDAFGNSLLIPFSDRVGYEK